MRKAHFNKNKKLQVFYSGIKYEDGMDATDQYSFGYLGYSQ